MIGKEFKINCKKLFSFLEKEYSFVISAEYAENDGKSDWIVYRSNNRAININYDWHDEYLYIILYKINDINSNLPDLGDSSLVLYVENLLGVYNIDYKNALHAEIKDYKEALKKGAHFLEHHCIDILNGSKWISNKELINGK
jgi:hypothetical protein